MYISTKKQNQITFAYSKTEWFLLRFCNKEVLFLTMAVCAKLSKLWSPFSKYRRRITPFRKICTFIHYYCYISKIRTVSWADPLRSNSKTCQKYAMDCCRWCIDTNKTSDGFITQIKYYTQIYIRANAQKAGLLKYVLPIEILNLAMKDF